jgi:hypothetical protein
LRETSGNRSSIDSLIGAGGKLIGAGAKLIGAGAKLIGAGAKLIGAGAKPGEHVKQLSSLLVELIDRHSPCHS